MNEYDALIAEAVKWEGMEWPDPIDEEAFACAQKVADGLISRLATALREAQAHVTPPVVDPDAEAKRLCWEYFLRRR